MSNCEFFEIIEWDEITSTVINAVCTLPSPTWPNCNRCQSRVEYNEPELDKKEAMFENNEPEPEKEEAMFFVINFGKMSRADMVKAMFMLSYYHVHTRMYSDGIKATSAYMVVGKDETHEDYDETLRMAEATFQSAFHQDDNLVCPHCSGLQDDEPKVDTCGHFNFTRQIQPAF